MKKINQINQKSRLVRRDDKGVVSYIYIVISNLLYWLNGAPPSILVCIIISRESIAGIRKIGINIVQLSYPHCSICA